MSYCDLEGPTFYREVVRTARKEHACVECSATILPGEQYYDQAGMWDRSVGVDSFRQHLLCRDACVWIRDVMEGECIPFGGLWEWWENEGKGWIPGEQRWDGTKSASRSMWLIGARMYAMVRRRERHAERARRAA
jgi:hypothetical protein